MTARDKSESLMIAAELPPFFEGLTRNGTCQL